MKTSLFAFVFCVILNGLSPLWAQSLPTPKNPHDNWVVQEVYPEYQLRMPVKRMGNSSIPMPAPSIKQSPFDSNTGELGSYFDAKTGISYDFRLGLMTNIFSGRVYQFYKKGTQPKPLPDGYEYETDDSREK